MNNDFAVECRCCGEAPVIDHEEFCEGCFEGQCPRGECGMFPIEQNFYAERANYLRPGE
jgi:hypothetical protein